MTPPSSSSFHGYQQCQSKNFIKGPRPSPLVINKTSHSIRKQPVSMTKLLPYQQQIRKPVIIYDISPKVIHTTPEKFKDVVQKLTGMSCTKDKHALVVNDPGTKNLDQRSLSNTSIISNIKQEKKDGTYDVNNEITSLSSWASNNNATNYEAADLNFAEIPPFTPNSPNLLISPYYSTSSMFNLSAVTKNLDQRSLCNKSISSSVKQEKKDGTYDVNNDITSLWASNKYVTNYEAADLNFAEIPPFTPNSTNLLISPYYSTSSIFNFSPDSSPLDILASLEFNRVKM